jgi:hypothetical protein
MYLVRCFNQVTSETCAKVLEAAIKEDPDYIAGCAKILVFANDGKAADEVAGFLESRGIA